MNRVVISGIFALMPQMSASTLSLSSTFDFFLSLWQPMPPMKCSLLLASLSCRKSSAELLAAMHGYPADSNALVALPPNAPIPRNP
jgi:hypothetical protein